MYTYDENGQKVPVPTRLNQKVQENFSMSSKNGKIVLWILVAIAVVVVVGIGIAMWRKNEMDTPMASPSPAAAMGMCGGGAKQRFGFRFY
jgi:hypothetical protein